MKKQTIARVYLNSIDSLVICFQPVENFSFIPNARISDLTIDDKKYHSDWVNSGDLLNADFTHGLEFLYNCNHFELKADATNIKYGSIGYFGASELIKELQRFKRIESKFSNTLSKLNGARGNLKIELSIIFELLNVVGATISTKNTKKSFGKSRSAIIDLISDINQGEQL